MSFSVAFCVKIARQFSDNVVTFCLVSPSRCRLLVPPIDNFCLNNCEWDCGLASDSESRTNGNLSACLLQTRKKLPLTSPGSDGPTPRVTNKNGYTHFLAPVTGKFDCQNRGFELSDLLAPRHCQAGSEHLCTLCMW